MRELIYTTVFFLMGLSLIVLLSFHHANATSSTQVGPLPTANPKTVECYGSVVLNTATWNEQLDCDDNLKTTNCKDSDHPEGGIITGYTYDCSGGDWTGCDDHCYAVCSTSQNPQSNCQWTAPPT